MVTLGVAVGLVLLPVLLSLVGPMVTTKSAASPPVSTEEEEEEQLADTDTSTKNKKSDIVNV